MPLSEHFKGRGETIMRKMKDRYGKKKGKKIFYATENKQKQKKSGKSAKRGMKSVLKSHLKGMVSRGGY